MVAAMFSIKMPWTRHKERLEELAELAEVQRRKRLAVKVTSSLPI
jgi:hypothetical protein